MQISEWNVETPNGKLFKFIYIHHFIDIAMSFSKRGILNDFEMDE